MAQVLHNGSDDFLCVQSFAMELPPGAGAGRRHGGVALICKIRRGLTCREITCNDSRLCGVKMYNENAASITVFGCYMPFWDGLSQTVDNNADITAKLDALIAAHRSSAPVALIGDYNCALPRMPVGCRPVNWAQLRGFSPLSYLMQDLLDDHGFTVAEFHFPQEVS